MEIEMAKKEMVVGAVLAAPLRDIAGMGEKVEAAATGLLSAIKRADLRTIGAFDDAIAAAFEANKWNTRPGRPAKDRRQVPHTVRTYVWEIRSAYRAGLEVWTFETMYALRMAKKALTEAAAEVTAEAPTPEEPKEAPVPEDVQQTLVGVRVLDIKRPNGALFHDLICTYILLPTGERALYGRHLSRILHKYQAALPEVKKAA
jgi:hypothetical protein